MQPWHHNDTVSWFGVDKDYTDPGDTFRHIYECHSQELYHKYRHSILNHQYSYLPETSTLNYILSID